jgi:hypothetical protein
VFVLGLKDVTEAIKKECHPGGWHLASGNLGKEMLLIELQIFMFGPGAKRPTLVKKISKVR